MAEHAANFTFLTQTKPSIFEVIAQKSLHDTLHPALQKVALLFSTNYPQKFQWLGKYYDEVFLVLDAALQYNYLNKYDATFSENFYGLKRTPCETGDKAVSLALAVLLPYLKRKLDEKVSFYRFEEADGCLRANFEGNLKRALILSHSTFEVTWGLLHVYNYVRYMAGRTEYQLPLLRLIALKYVYAEPDQSPSIWALLFSGQFAWSKVSLLKNLVTSSFEVAAFFLQFMQVWNAEKSNYNMTALPTVPAPNKDSKAKNYNGKCPLCLQNWKIPTVLPVSGYVFCFPCILRYLRENQKCPVTNLPAKPLDIVRLYDAD